MNARTIGTCFPRGENRMLARVMCSLNNNAQRAIEAIPKQCHGRLGLSLEHRSLELKPLDAYSSPATRHIAEVAPRAVGMFVAAIMLTACTHRTAIEMTEWQSAPPMLSARAAHAVAANARGIVALAGTGASGEPVISVERFDGKAWQHIANLPPTLIGGLNAPAAAFVGDTLYLAGGFSATSNSPVAEVWALDTRTSQWSPRAAMPAPRGGHAMISVGSHIHVVGGGNDQATLAEHLRYDPASNAWTALAPLPRAKGSPALVVAGGSLIAIGGRSGGEDFGDVHRYDARLDTWVPLANVEARGTAGAANYCGRVWLIGGESQREVRVLDRVERIAERSLLASDRWQIGQRLGTARAFARTAVFDGRLFVVGGAIAYSISNSIAHQ